MPVPALGFDQDAELFKALGNLRRLRILAAQARAGQWVHCALTPDARLSHSCLGG
jgi:hypothetical protein